MAKSRKEPKLTGDAALMAKWDKITDPKKMLQAVVASQWCLGGDPYYSDLLSALLRNVERVAK